MNSHRRPQSTLAVSISALMGALMLPLGLGLPAVGAETEAPELDCAQTATTTAEEAFILASACDGDIAILDEQTPWKTIYATPHGTVREELSTSAVRTEVNGEWEPIDTSVSRTADGITVDAPVFDMAFSTGGPEEPLATIVKDGHVLVMDAPVALTSPVIDGRTITYPAVLDGVDLIVSVDADGTGFSQVLRVADAKAAANPQLETLTFPIETSENLELEGESGGFIAVDDGGETIFTSPQPLMWDSSTETAPQGKSTTFTIDTLGEEPGTHDETRPGEGSTVAPMPVTIGTDEVLVEPDQEMLTDTETVWPVYIDPSVTGTRSVRTAVMSAFPTSNALYNFADDEGVGYCSSSLSAACTRSGIHYMFFGFTGLSTVANLSADDIISATFRVYGTHSWSCTPTGMEAWVTNSVSASTTWNTQPAWISKMQTQTLAHRPSCSSGNTPRWITWNAKSAAQRAANIDSSTVTIGLSSVNDNNMAASWQRYRNDAQFWVEYSRPPTAPTNLHSDPVSHCSATTASYIRSTTPRLNWALTDPDGGNVKGIVDIIRVSDGASIWAPPATAEASGNYFSRRVPNGILSEGVTYEWRAKGQDVQTGKFGPAAKCRFTIDSTGPANPPTIRPADGYSPRYPEGQTSGGAGLAGAFTFGNGGVQDVVMYKYSFNSDALDKFIATGANGEATVPYTPASSGQHTLYVKSVDKAGNTSERTHYIFGVSTSKPEATWRLDEGNGGIAADSAGTNGLTVTALWADGAGADPTLLNPPMLTDKALEFTKSTHTATSAHPAVKTTGSYTVMARVNTSQLTKAATVISQDGSNNAAFRLGLLPASECESTGPCWAFQTSESDSATSAFTTVTSGSSVEKNRWYHITGVRDAANNKIQLHVCPLSEPEPAVSDKTTTTGGWNATGSTQLGRSRMGTGYGQPWQGRIDQVRIDNVALTSSRIKQACNSGSDVFPPMGSLPPAPATPPARQWGPTEPTSNDLLGAWDNFMYYFEGGYDSVGQKPTFGPYQKVQSLGWATMTSVTQAKGFTTSGLGDIIALENTGKLWLNTSSNNGITWKELATGWGWADHIVGVNNWGGSGTAGLIARQASNGTLWYYPYTPETGFGAYTQIGGDWRQMKNISFAGNWDHDIYPDLLAIDGNGRLRLYRGNSTNSLQTGFTVLDEAGGWQDATSLTSGADYNHDGTPDILAAWKSGNLWFYPNVGGSLQTYQLVPGSWSDYKIID